MVCVGEQVHLDDLLLNIPFRQVVVEVDLPTAMCRWLRGEAPLLLVDAARVDGPALSALCHLQPLRSRQSIILLCWEEGPAVHTTPYGSLPVMSVAELASLRR